MYEDDDTIAFLDIHPVTQGHTLVVPKAHSEGLHDAAVDILTRSIVAIQKIARAAEAALGASGFNIGQNNGTVAGQAIPHLHFHVIPRYAGDGLTHWPGRAYREGEAEEIAEKIRAAFDK